MLGTLAGVCVNTEGEQSFSGLVDFACLEYFNVLQFSSYFGSFSRY